MTPYLLTICLSLTLYFNNLMHPKSVLLAIGLAVILLIANFHKKTAKINQFTPIVLLYIAFSWISYFFSETRNLGLSEIVLESSVWTIFLTLINFEKIKTSFITYPISILAFLEAAFGIYQFSTRPENRVAGTFLSWYEKTAYYPNALALFFVISLPLIFSFNITKKYHQFLYIILLTTTFTGLLLTFSRGGLLVFGIESILILTYLIYQKNWRKIILSVICIILGCILFFSLNQLRDNPQNLTQKYSFQGTEKITSVGERAQFFKGSLQLIKKEPIWGFGPSSFSYIYPQVQPLFLANSPHPHNWFLKIGVERGLITLVSFLIITISLLILIIRNRQLILANPTLYFILIGLTGGVLHNQLDFNFNFTSNYLLMILLLGILVSNLDFKFKKQLAPNVIIFISIILLGGNWLSNEINLKIAAINYDNNPIKSIEVLSNLNYENSNYILADLYLQNNQLKMAIKSYQQQIRLNPLDALAYYNLGQLTHKNDDYYLAIQKDPMNFFKYYLAYLKNGGDKIKFDDMKKILTNYEPLAKNNLHFTAQTGNIKDAIEICNLLLKKKTDSDLIKIRNLLMSYDKSFSRH